MAAGRHGGYRDNEFRDRESDIDFSRRDLYYSKDTYDKFRNSEGKRAHAHELERGKDSDVRDRIRSGEKDIREREVVNGGYNSSISISREKDVKEREVVNGGFNSSTTTGNSGSIGSGHRRSVFSTKLADREPGELSSGSESDDGTFSDSKKDVEVSMPENVMEVAGKKRKFSPIVWDIEDKDAINSSKNKTAATSPLLPPPPPLPKSIQKMPNLIPQGVAGASLSRPFQVQSLQPSSTNPPVAPMSVASISDSPDDLSSTSPREGEWSNDQEPGQVVEENFYPARNISASRWANESNYLGNEDESSNDENRPKKRKKMLTSELLDTRSKTKTSSSELGEFIRGSSEGARSKSSESEVDRHVGPSSGDEYPKNELDRNGFMEVEGDDANNGANACYSDTGPEESDSHMIAEPIVPSQRSINMLHGCRSVHEFERLNKIDEGTYGVVFRARDKKSGEIVALKKVKMEKEREGFPLTSLREINILLSFHHPSVVDVKEVVVGSSLDSIFMVMEYMEHDLKGLMESTKQPFSQSEVKCLMLQLLEGVMYLHDNWVLHRDLKTSNLLLNNRGELKICDFGLSRQYGSPLKPYTHLVVTLWYRAPELLLGAKQYSTAIDMWSLGCIMAELLSKQPLFSGKTELDQLDKIFKTLGTPNETIWPGFSKLPGVKVNFVKHQYNLLRKKFPASSFTGSPVLSESGFDLLNKLLTYDPEKRITAEAALNHEWFREVPLPKSKDFMPTFPAQHAQDRRMQRIMKSPDPLQEQRRKELLQGELGIGGLFG